MSYEVVMICPTDIRIGGFLNARFVALIFADPVGMWRSEFSPVGRKWIITVSFHILSISLPSNIEAFNAMLSELRTYNVVKRTTNK
jgi:hypothetical protein